MEVNDLSFEKKLKIVKDAVKKYKRGENTLRVSRFSLLQDLKKLEPRVFKKKPFVKFQGETAYDAGGPRKDFFSFVTREFTNPENKLFQPTVSCELTHSERGDDGDPSVERTGGRFREVVPDVWSILRVCGGVWISRLVPSRLKCLQVLAKPASRSRGLS